MKKRKLLLLTILIILGGCGTSKNHKKHDVPDGGFNLFSVEKDKELGAQVHTQIHADPTTYPILDSASNVEAYNYIYNIRDKILATGKVKYENEFPWKFHIIDADVLNAFATPGGYVYIYSGIIKYLDNEAELAGVIGHEMAHADLRHSTRQMTKSFGVQIVLNAALGDSSALGQITQSLLSLKFSRKFETESDRLSVEYLCGTNYPADGGAGFFEKIEAEGGASTPEFLSTHPSPDNRIENYHHWAEESGCAGKEMYEARYAAFKQLFN